MMMNTHERALLILSGVVLVLVAIQGCKTVHVTNVYADVEETPEVIAIAPDVTPDVTPVAVEELPVDITMILDRSGSMQTFRAQVITSFNDFLEEQKTVDGEATVTLVQFNHEYSPVYSAVDLHSADSLNTDNYIAKGNTALFDAIGRTIAETKERVKKGSADVVFVITTDGLENSSKEYSGTQINELIEECKSEYGWHFMFLAASEDAFNQRTTLGIPMGTCFEVGNSPEAWKKSQDLMSQQLGVFRNTRNRDDLNFKDEDRD